MTDKVFKTVQEQLSILKSRGLTISDPSAAESFLLRNNYYRISGYSLTLRNHDRFYPHASFQNIMDIYAFDHELRHILLHFIECIEVAFKSVYSYEFSKVHGPMGYLQACHFTNPLQHTQIIQKANEQRDRRHAHEAYLKHFLDDLHQDIPLWAYVDLLTISDISFLYAISEEHIKKAVAAQFGLTVSSGYRILGNFMHSMTILRNLCAHGSRLFNRLFEQKPSLNRTEQTLLIVHENGSIDNAHLYGFVLIMRRLLTVQEFAAFKGELIALTQRYPFVAMKYYGFRDDWKEKL